jgi:hypothetical protein
LRPLRPAGFQESALARRLAQTEQRLYRLENALGQSSLARFGGTATIGSGGGGGGGGFQPGAGVTFTFRTQAGFPLAIPIPFPASVPTRWRSPRVNTEFFGNRIALVGGGLAGFDPSLGVLFSVAPSGITIVDDARWARVDRVFAAPAGSDGNTVVLYDALAGAFSTYAASYASTWQGQAITTLRNNPMLPIRPTATAATHETGIVRQPGTQNFRCAPALGRVGNTLVLQQAVVGDGGSGSVETRSLDLSAFGTPAATSYRYVAGGGYEWLSVNAGSTLLWIVREFGGEWEVAGLADGVGRSVAVSADGTVGWIPFSASQQHLLRSLTPAGAFAESAFGAGTQVFVPTGTGTGLLEHVQTDSTAASGWAGPVLGPSQAGRFAAAWVEFVGLDGSTRLYRARVAELVGGIGGVAWQSDETNQPPAPRALGYGDGRVIVATLRSSRTNSLEPDLAVAVDLDA